MGYLKLIIGPMYAGKSTELIRHIRQFKFLKKNILAINNNINNRYGSVNIITHNKEEFKDCINVDLLKEVTLKYNIQYNKADVLIIEELQFFKDAYKNIIDFVERDNKTVICAGLIGDYLRNPFGDILRLIPIADDIQILSALCNRCKDGTKALFTKRIVNNTEQHLIGSSESYISVCRHHYFND